MVYRTDEKSFNVKMQNGKMTVVGNSYHIDDKEIGGAVDPAEVITADGYERDILTINGGFPGPTLEVVKGAQVR